MKALIAIVVLAISAGCSSPGCLLQQKGVDVVVPVVVGTLQCQNAAEVKKSIEAIVKPLGLCEQKTGAIGSFVCPAASKAVVDFLAKNVIPAAWGCSAVNAKASLQAALLGACLAIPVSE